MKPSFMSGVQKRKRAVEEKEIIMKLPKVTFWLNPGGASAIRTVPSNTASTSTSTASNHPHPDTSVLVLGIFHKGIRNYVKAEVCAIKVTDLRPCAVM